MPTFKRPDNPEFLIQACYRLFGEACLNCGLTRPLEMAHIRNWPSCVAFAGSKVGGIEPPKGWHYAVAVDNFHNLSNVVPLCRNCHGNYDHKDPTITECEILELRNVAVQRPEVLAHIIDFIGTELSGRPNRCQHKDDNGKRQHTHMIDSWAAAMPLPWVSAAYRTGILTKNPHMIVVNSAAHHHVWLNHAAVDHCLGDLAKCQGDSWVWSHQTRSMAT